MFFDMKMGLKTLNQPQPPHPNSISITRSLRSTFDVALNNNINIKDNNKNNINNDNINNNDNNHKTKQPQNNWVVTSS